VKKTSSIHLVNATEPQDLDALAAELAEELARTGSPKVRKAKDRPQENSELADAVGAAASSPNVDYVTGEPAEKTLPEASPPPSSSRGKQKVASKLDLEGIRKTRGQVTASVRQIVKIPVVSSLDSSLFIRVHPTFGGLDDPLPVWKIEGVGGQNRSGVRLVEPGMVDLIRSHGGKVSMCGLWWGQYSANGGQFLVAVSVESDNDWIDATRKILENARAGWLKRVNAGNCWQGKTPPSPIPEPGWPELTWDEVLNLAFDETVNEDSRDFQWLVYGGPPPTVEL
jgi:hypothetical protein